MSLDLTRRALGYRSRNICRMCVSTGKACGLSMQNSMMQFATLSPTPSRVSSASRASSYEASRSGHEVYVTPCNPLRGGDDIPSAIAESQVSQRLLSCLCEGIRRRIGM